MPNRVPAVRCIKARHPSMGTSLSSTGVSWRTLWGIQVTHAIAPAHYLLPRPSIRADSARNAVELTVPIIKVQLCESRIRKCLANRFETQSREKHFQRFDRRFVYRNLIFS